MQIKRIYSELARYHLANDRQMLFFSGPRQVGKTTLCAEFQDFYYNWDNLAARTTILKGEEAVASDVGLDAPKAVMPVIAFDELHHYAKWKQFLKGFFDVYGAKSRIFVTGSARLNGYKKIGDSLMGRYYLLKAVEFWTDFGFGEYGLHYIRTKQEKEVDFLVSKDGRPWMLVECKSQSRNLSKTLVEFQRKLMVPYAFQVVFDAPYEAIDCFDFKKQAVIVPARSFLSQLV